MSTATFNDYFSVENLGPIFQTDSPGSDKLKSRENGYLEFKESFNWGNKNEYARTIAAFANSKGGYLVFGVTNSPRTLKGLTSDKFENTDTAKITEYLNEYFHPEIQWEMSTYDFQDKKFGILYIKESHNKPIVCAKNAHPTLVEGAIYYRYRGRTQTIKFTELRQILEEQRRFDQQMILSHLKKVSEIGIRNAAILDSNSGIVSGPGGSFIIDESLLPKIKFIKEGHFTESMAAPAIKLIGSAEALQGTPIQPIKKIVTTKALRSTDLFISFFNKEKVSSPIEYLKQICFESSAFYPIYYYLKLANLRKEDVIPQIETLNTRGQTKIKLIERLKKVEDFSLSHSNTATKAYEERDVFVKQILSKTVDSPTNKKEAIRLLQAVKTLKKSSLDADYILPLLNEVYDNFYSTADSSLATEIRQSTCHVDKILYG